MSRNTIKLILPDEGGSIRTVASKRYFVVRPAVAENGKAYVAMRTDNIEAADREVRLRSRGTRVWDNHPVTPRWLERNEVRERALIARNRRTSDADWARRVGRQGEARRLFY